MKTSAAISMQFLLDISDNTRKEISQCHSWKSRKLIVCGRSY